MENKEKPETTFTHPSLLEIALIVIGLIFAVGGILTPRGDLRAIGLGLQLQIIGIFIMVLRKK